MSSHYPPTSQAPSNATTNVERLSTSNPDIDNVNLPVASKPSPTPTSNDVGLTKPLTAMLLDEQKKLILLECLLISGRRKRFEFDPSVEVRDVRHYVWRNWPQEWNEDCPNDIYRIRLLYLGRFLDDDVKLESLDLPIGIPTIVHLVLRPIEVDLNVTKAERKKSAGCSCCVIS